MAETATESITIEASPERVWEIAVDIENYPEWARDIKNVTVRATDDRGPPVRSRVPGVCARAKHPLHPRLRLHQRSR